MQHFPESCPSNRSRRIYYTVPWRTINLQRLTKKQLTVVNLNLDGWGCIWLSKLKTEKLNMAWIKSIFILNLFLTKHVRMIYCFRFLSKKMLFYPIFNQKVKASTCLWWCFCLFQQAESNVWLPGDQQECKWGVGGLSQGVLSSSYWSHRNHMWLPAARLQTFL